MGCDIHLTLARVNALPPGEDDNEKNAVRVVGFNNDQAMQYAQLEFESVSDGPMQNYDLFSWLAGIRGDLKPLVDADKLKEATRGFLDWCDKQHNDRLENEMRKKHDGSAYYWWGYSSENFIDTFLDGDHSFVLYPLALLSSFDYDQQVVLRPPSKYDDMAHHLEMEAQYANTTYREVFGRNWFEFLEWAVRDKWDLAIFSFDS